MIDSLKLELDNIKAQLEEYFGGKPSLMNKVEIVIDEALVQGPAYEEDAVSEKRYYPFQFIHLEVK